MNEEKNNIGAQNIGLNNNELPPMNTVSTGNVNSQDMSVNTLPPMEGMTDVNVQSNSVQNKYGLPPISNFTNFNTSYETPKLDDNTSVFDLMDQFESVGNSVGINQQVASNTESTVDNMQNQNLNRTVTPNLNASVVSNGLSQTNNLENVSSIPSMSTIPEINNNIPSIPVLNQNTVNNTNGTNSAELLSMFSGNTNLVNNIPKETSIPTEVNNQPIESMNDNALNIFGGIGGVNQVPNNNAYENNRVVPNQNISVLNNTQNDIPVSNTQDVTFNNINTGILDDNQSNSTEVNQASNNSFIVNTPNFQDSNSIPDNIKENSSINSTVVNQDQQNDGLLNIPNNQMDDNQMNSVVEIPTTSIDNLDNTTNNTTNNTNNNSDGSASELITSFNNNTPNITIDSNQQQNSNDSANVSANVDNSAINNNVVSNVDKTTKKKKGKLIFVILLIVTILILSAVGVLSYFMFFKTDKLVCGFQDYSNEQYILDESMVYKFKGNKMTDAQLSQVLTFTEDNLDKKDSYLEELKNQYQGLGFNVSFVENEDGFEINMNFTKSELESWYGTSLKNSSKTQMKKEMRDSGYTCK